MSPTDKQVIHELNCPCCCPRSQTLHELASAQAELRGMVLDVGRDVAQLRDQVEAQLQQADSQPQAAG